MQQQFHNQPAEEHPSENMPGCGLASYGCLLFMFFLVGLAGLISSSLSLLQANLTRPPFDFRPGHQVEVWRLQPMRDAKLLQLTEVPEWYHDESSSGEVACALSNGALLRVDHEESWRIPYEALQSVEIKIDGENRIGIVHTIDDQILPCLFVSGEGVERFTAVIRQKIADSKASSPVLSPVLSPEIQPNIVP